MPNYTINYAEMSTTPTDGGGKWEGVQKVFSPLQIEADNRVAAYLAAYQRFRAEGHNVAVIKPLDADHPLRFTKEEVKQVEAAGVPLDTSSPNGVLIQEIIEANNQSKLG